MIALRSAETSGLPTMATAFCSLLRKEPVLPSAARQINPFELVQATWVAGTLASLTSREAAPRLAEPAPWKRKRRPRASATRSVHAGFWILSPPG